MQSACKKHKEIDFQNVTGKMHILHKSSKIKGFQTLEIRTRTFICNGFLRKEIEIMGVISLSDVKSAPSRAMMLYDKYRGRIAQVRTGAPADRLKQELLADSFMLQQGCDVYCRDCINEVVDYLMGCFVEDK